MDIGGLLLDGTTVEIRTMLTAPVTIDLTRQDTPTSPFVRFMRPTITIRKGGSVVAKVSPYGDPGTGLPLLIMLGSALALGLLAWSYIK